MELLNFSSFYWLFLFSNILISWPQSLNFISLFWSLWKRRNFFNFLMLFFIFFIQNNFYRFIGGDWKLRMWLRIGWSSLAAKDFYHSRKFSIYCWFFLLYDDFFAFLIWKFNAGCQLLYIKIFQIIFDVTNERPQSSYCWKFSSHFKPLWHCSLMPLFSAFVFESFMIVFALRSAVSRWPYNCLFILLMHYDDGWF